MTSLASNAYFSHPWFNQPTMKRRHSLSEDELPDRLTLSPSTSSKRRRVAALERGFSNLSLQPVSPYGVVSLPSVSPPPPALAPETFAAMEVEYLDSSSLQPSILPDSVEEPTSPVASAPEIRMKGSSWYEPEPDRESSPTTSKDSPKPRFSGIVVTDLESSDDEEEQEPHRTIVSPALLDHIRRRELQQSTVIPPLQNRQSLVLYRPLTRPPITPPEEDNVWPTPVSDVAESSDSCVSEVDMMDVE